MKLKRRDFYKMAYSPQSANKGSRDAAAANNTPARKVYRSKMTDAYAMDDLGDEVASPAFDQYFEDDSMHMLNEINLLFDKIVQYYFTPTGLTPIQIPILITLLKDGPMTVSQLGKSLEIGSSNITPLCKRLEAMQLVTRTRDTYDQRVVFVSITDKARELLVWVNKEIRDKTGHDAPALTTEEQDVVRTGMQLLRTHLSNVVTSTEKQQQTSELNDKRRQRLEAARIATEQSESRRQERKKHGSITSQSKMNPMVTEVQDQDDE